MAARPKGTDGRDFKYRETIETTYQRAAHSRGVITRCLAVHFGIMAVRAVWTSLANAAAGRGVAFEVVVVGLLELAVAVLWRAARPGHARESLPLLKAFNIAQALIATLQFLYIFEYYVADLRKFPDMGAVAARRLADEGLVAEASVASLTEALRGFTLFLDLTLLLFVLFGVRTAHVLIMDKMQAQKARESKRAVAAAAGATATGGAAAAAAGNGGGSGSGSAAAAAAQTAAVATAAKASDRTRARRRHA